LPSAIGADAHESPLAVDGPVRPNSIAMLHGPAPGKIDSATSGETARGPRVT
jgi:hypothetical protein